MTKVIRHPDFQEDLVLGIGSLKIRWMIGPRHDRLFARNVLLPWAMPEARVLSADTNADVTVGLFLDCAPPERTAEFYDTPGLRFILYGEPEIRTPVGNGIYGFFQGPQATDDPDWTRYCPLLLAWTPPMTVKKTKPLSAIEGNKRPWRLKAALKLGKKAGFLDGFGSGFNKPLGGYHGPADSPLVFEKFQGLADYAFHFAQERVALDDYLTEKFFDPILCECVPIYSGCPNVLDYVVPECFVPLEEAHRVDWRNWQAEYARRQRFVQYQKEQVRKTFNFLSYFARLAETPELLSNRRPITLHTQLAAATN
jgi:hypothetical protein